MTLVSVFGDCPEDKNGSTSGNMTDNNPTITDGLILMTDIVPKCGYLIDI
jgi:hypothetical protein